MRAVPLAGGAMSKPRRLTPADADSLGIRLEDLIGPGHKTREEHVAELARGSQNLIEQTNRILATLTPREEQMLRMRFRDFPKPWIKADVVRERVLVWCHTCGCSFDWPWGRCIYECERCGSGRMSALDPGGQRG